MRDTNFDKEFNETKRTIQRKINAGYTLYIIRVVFVSIAIVVAVYNIITYPEAIGQFFGKIVSGFNSVVK